MRGADHARLAIQALGRYPLRTSMMLVAIAIGVAAVVMLTSVAEGARRYVTGQFAALGTQTLAVIPGRAETAGGIPGMLMGETARDLTIDDAAALLRSPRVARIAPLIIGSGSASRGSRLREVTVIGTNAEFLDILSWEVQSGQFLPRMDLHVASPACVVGSTVRRELFPAESPLGQWLRIGETRCRVIGTLSEAGTAGGFNTDETVVLPVANALQLFNSAGLFRIIVEATSRDALEAARRDVLRIIAARHQGEEDVTVVTQDALVDAFDSVFDMITLGLAAIAGISLIVAGVLIMNVMLVAVAQRTDEIGLLKAIGARRAQILTLFLTEAACLSVVGALAGAVLGGLGILLLRAVFPVVDFVPPAWAVVAALAVAVASGILFGVLPARRAARLDPVAALAGH